VALPQTNVRVESGTSDDQRETRQTAQVIEVIAVQFSLPLSQVQEIMNIQIHRLHQRARIKQYVSILAVKQVKELLRTNQR